MNPLALGQKAMEIGGILAFVFGATWYVAEPRAQDFIKQTVNDRIQTVEQTTEQIQKQQRQQDLSNVRTESDLATVKAQQRDVQAKLDVIIQKLIDDTRH